jgi:hypothetical protein
MTTHTPDSISVTGQNSWMKTAVPHDRLPYNAADGESEPWWNRETIGPTTTEAIDPPTMRPGVVVAQQRHAAIVPFRRSVERFHVSCTCLVATTATINNGTNLSS